MAGGWLQHAVARCAVWRRSFGPIPTFTTFETMVAIKYNRKGRPIFGTLWQRLWWGLGCWSHERRETKHYHVHIYWRIVDGNLESFSNAQPRQLRPVS